MKKWIALLLAAVLCLSLAACGNGSELEKYEKYETLINYMEAEDYESALAEMIRISGYADETEDNEPEDGEPEDTQPTEAEPVEQTIEITLDNWQEYFEINQYLSVSYVANAFGEPTGSSLELFTILEPKEAYSYHTVDVAMEYNVDYRTSDILYNLDDFSFELTDCISHPDATVSESAFKQQVTSSMSIFFPMSRDQIVNGKVEKNTVIYTAGESYPPSFAALIDEQTIEQNEDGTGYLRLCPTNIQITRIEGTLEYNN